MGWVQKIPFSVLGKEVEFLRRSAAVMENDGLEDSGSTTQLYACRAAISYFIK